MKLEIFMDIKYVAAKIRLRIFCVVLHLSLKCVRTLISTILSKMLSLMAQ